VVDGVGASPCIFLPNYACQRNSCRGSILLAWGGQH
jgi:hypothetical protein